MLRKSRWFRTTAIGLTCALIGAGTSAIAAAGAHYGHGDSNRDATSGAQGEGWHHGGGLFAAVHGDLVVPYNGSFSTVTFDRGTVDSVSGQDLSVVEGTDSATYKTVTLTIPSDAKISNDGSSSTLSQLSHGERVLVVQAAQGTFVIARSADTSSGANQQSPEHRSHHRW